MSKHAELPQLGLAGLFITALITAQLIAVKLLTVPFPDIIPVVGTTVLVPAGVLAYALTFFASDCYAELYGRRSAQYMVNIGFLMNFVMLALVWVAIVAPGSPAGVNPGMFANVLGLSTNIVIASLTAYLVSQNWDVYVFDAIRERTGARRLWLRNLASTASSQLIDTMIFILVAFYAIPTILGLGQPLPEPILLQMIVGQYLLKLLIAVIDTPLIYAVIAMIRRQETLRTYPHIAE